MAREIPNIPQGIQDQLSKTPAERKAELLARRQARLDALTPQQRQKVQDRIPRSEVFRVLLPNGSKAPGVIKYDSPEAEFLPWPVSNLGRLLLNDAGRHPVPSQNRGHLPDNSLHLVVGGYLRW